MYFTEQAKKRLTKKVMKIHATSRMSTIVTNPNEILIHYINNMNGKFE